MDKEAVKRVCESAGYREIVQWGDSYIGIYEHCPDEMLSQARRQALAMLKQYEKSNQKNRS